MTTSISPEITIDDLKALIESRLNAAEMTLDQQEAETGEVDCDELSELSIVRGYIDDIRERL